MIGNMTFLDKYLRMSHIITPFRKSSQDLNQATLDTGTVDLRDHFSGTKSANKITFSEHSYVFERFLEHVVNNEKDDDKKLMLFQKYITLKIQDADRFDAFLKSPAGAKSKAKDLKYINSFKTWVFNSTSSHILRAIQA